MLYTEFYEMESCVLKIFLFCKSIQSLCCPLAELPRAFEIDAIFCGCDEGQGVKPLLIGLLLSATSEYSAQV